MSFYLPDGGIRCDRCGRGLYGGPLDHLTEEERTHCAALLDAESASDLNHGGGLAHGEELD